MFFWKEKKCIRCWVYELSSQGKIEVPACFGKLYLGDGGCGSCSLREACRIDLFDRALASPDVGLQQDLQGEPSFVDYVHRVLRMAGKPLHIQDLAPLLMELSHGKFQPEVDKSYRMLWSTLLRAKQVVSLGDGFFVWSGYQIEEKAEQLTERKPYAVQLVRPQSIESTS